MGMSSCTRNSRNSRLSRMTSYRGSKYLHHSYGRIHQCKMDLQSTHPGRRARSSMNPCSRCSTCSASSDTYIPRSPMAPMRRQPSPTVATDDATTHVRRAGTNRQLHEVLKHHRRRRQWRRSAGASTRKAGRWAAERRRRRVHSPRRRPPGAVQPETTRPRMQPPAGIRAAAQPHLSRPQKRVRCFDSS
jgi:hypothetical protein